MNTQKRMHSDLISSRQINSYATKDILRNLEKEFED
jgi:hypothetical protein